jgi:hypothetical protein
MLEWSTSDEGWSRVKHSVSDKTLRELCSSRIVLWSQRTLSFAARSWMRPIALDTSSTPEPTKCIKIWRTISGGREWRGKSQDMCQSVTRVEGSRPMIWGQLEICSLWAFLSGSGKTYAWTSSWVCLAPHMGTTWYGSLCTTWPSRLTLYTYPPHTGSDNMPRSTCHTLSAIMVSRRPLSLTEGQSLWHSFRNNYVTVWAPISSVVQPIIPRRTGKLNESIKSSRICSVLVLWAMVQNGTSITHSLSSHIATVIKKASRCYLLKHFMDGPTAHR